MKVSQIEPIRVSDCSYLFATADLFSDRDENLIEMPVETFDHCSVGELMEEHDDVSPAVRWPARNEAQAVGDRVDGISEVRVLSADPVEVVSQMATGEKWLGIVGQGAVAAAYWKIESDGIGSEGQLNGSGNGESGIENCAVPGIQQSDPRRVGGFLFVDKRMVPRSDGEEDDQQYSPDQNRDRKDELPPFAEVLLQIEIRKGFQILTE